MVEHNLGAGQQIVRVNVNEFRAKFKSKAECFNFLAQVCHCYLPSYETVTIYHLKDLIANKKKRISNDAMKYIHCPQYDSLSLDKIFSLILQHKREILQYLPDQRDLFRLPRQYVLNVIYTLEGKNFYDWVQEKIKDRNDSVAKDKDMMIEMDPEVFRAFSQSTMISTAHGNGSQLLKAGSKRRRNKAEMTEYRQEQESREDAIADKNDRIRELEMENARQTQAMQSKDSEINQTKSKLFDVQEKADKNERYSNLVTQMQDAGAITFNENGTVTVVQSEADQQIMGNDQNY